MPKENFIKPERMKHVDPVTYYNTYKVDEAINIFNAHHRRNKNGLALFIENNRTTGGEVVIKDGVFIIADHPRIEKLPRNTKLTAFQIFFILEHDSNFDAAVAVIKIKHQNIDSAYLRVGVDYFKVIKKPDRHGILRTELKRWKKDELKTDYGPDYIKLLPKYDDFTIQPNNLNYQPVIFSGEYKYRNLYNDFDWKPAKGSVKWSKVLLKHVFGDQYELGLKYMQCLFLYPQKILPILVMVSEERSTGKTTFINWCNEIFGANCVNINPSDLTSDFNGIYSRANIITIEEALLEKQPMIEKLKNITTAKYVSVNQKHIDNYKIPFYGKVIIASNNVRTFARIDEKEIRFWIRELKEIKTRNTAIEEDLVIEIPAFLHYLTTLPEIDFSKSRMVFTPEEISNANLDIVKEESRPSLYKEILINIQEYFDENETADKLDMSLKDIKHYWFERYHNINKAYIRTILKEYFNIEPSAKTVRYFPINSEISSTGKIYSFLRSEYSTFETKNIKIDDTEEPDDLFTISNEVTDAPF